MSDPTAPSSFPSEPAPGSTTPPPVSQATAPAPAAAPSSTSDTGLPSNIAAMLACLFSIVGGIVFLVIEKKDQFVRFYAMQSTILGGVAFALSIALQIVTWILIHIPFVGGLIGFLFGLVGAVVGLAFLVVSILALYKAFKGTEWEIPYVGKIAREQLAKMTPASPTAPTAP